MDLKNSMILANMMSKKGGGVEFKTSIYATGGAYIVTPFTFGEIYGIKAKGSVTSWLTVSDETYPMIAGYVSGNYTQKRGVCLIKNSGNKCVSININDNIVQSVNNESIFDLTNQQSSPVGVNNYAFPIFAQNSSGSSFLPLTKWSTYGSVKLEEIVLFNQNLNKIAHFKPAIVEGESGMYDTINEQFYGNANTVGSLICE